MTIRVADVLAQAARLRVARRLPSRPVIADVLENVPRLPELLKASPRKLGYLDIASINLACAENLPGSEEADPVACLRTLDEWAAMDGVTNGLTRPFALFAPREPSFSAATQQPQ